MSDYPLRKDQVINLLKSASDGIEIRYNAPVYLVGSYHAKGNESLDIDIVIVFTDKQLKQVFGPNYFGQNFSGKNFRFRNKQKKWYWAHEPLSAWDIDFKEQSIELFKYEASKSGLTVTRLGSYADTCYLSRMLKEVEK